MSPEKEAGIVVFSRHIELSRTLFRNALPLSCFGRMRERPKSDSCEIIKNSDTCQGMIVISVNNTQLMLQDKGEVIVSYNFCLMMSNLRSQTTSMA